MIPQGCCIAHAEVIYLKVIWHVQEILVKICHFLPTKAISQIAMSEKEAYPDLVGLPQAGLSLICLTPKM